MKISKDRLRQLIKEEVSRAFPYLLDEVEAAEQEKPAHLSDSQWAAIQRERKFAKTGNMEDLIPPEEEPEEEEADADDEPTRKEKRAARKEKRKEKRTARRAARDGDEPSADEPGAAESGEKPTHAIFVSGFDMMGQSRVDVRAVEAATGDIFDPKGFSNDIGGAKAYIQELMKKYPNHIFKVDSQSAEIKALEKVTVQ